MAYANFYKYYSEASYATNSGSSDQVYLHRAPIGTASSLTSSQGTYSRQYSYVNLASSWGEETSFSTREVKYHLSGSSFENLPAGSFISVRAKVRISNTAQQVHTASLAGDKLKYTHNYLGVCIYAPSSSATTNDDVGSSATVQDFGGGYNLVLQQYWTDYNQKACRLMLLAQHDLRKAGYSGATHDGYNISQYDVLGGGLQQVCSGSYTTDTWYHIRLDFIPASVHEGTLSAYTSADNGLNWDEVGSFIVREVNVSAWRTNGNLGFASFYNSEMVEWGPYNGLDEVYIAHNIDDFRVYLDSTVVAP